MEKIKKTNPYRDIGLRVKLVRKALKKSQEKFALGLKTNRSTLSNIESGKIQFSVNLLKNLYDKHQVDLNWLFSGVGEMFFKGIKTVSQGINEKPLKIKGKPLIKSQTKELLELMKIKEFRDIIFHKKEELKYFFRKEIDENGTGFPVCRLEEKNERK